MSALLNALGHSVETMVNKLIHHVGVWVGIGGGAAVHAVKTSEAVQKLPHWQQLILEYGAVVTFIAGIVLIFKNVHDIIISRRKDKREQQLHDLKLKDNEHTSGD